MAEEVASPLREEMHNLNETTNKNMQAQFAMQEANFSEMKKLLKANC